MGSYSLDDLNAMSQEDFTVVLGEIFEHTPAIAHRAWAARPFHHLDELHGAMVAVMRSLSADEQLALICAHPDLGSRATMAAASVEEQASVGLNHLTPDEYERLLSLNQHYRDRFNFPFILAVRNHTKDSIFQNLGDRLHHDRKTELQTALREIETIAHLRLDGLLANSSRGYSNF